MGEKAKQEKIDFELDECFESLKVGVGLNGSKIEVAHLKTSRGMEGVGGAFYVFLRRGWC